MAQSAQEAVTAVPSEARPPEYDESIIQMLTSKILIDWLRNRQQLLVPLTVDMQKLEAEQADNLIYAMVAAAQADGAVEAGDRQRLDAALTRLNAAEAHRTTLAAAIETRKSLGEVLARVPDVQTGAVVYAASLLSIDRRKRVNRYYLRYLASRLKLPPDLSRSLEQRYTATM